MSPEDVQEMIGMLAGYFQMRRVPRLDLAGPVSGPSAVALAFASYEKWLIHFSKRLPVHEYEATTAHEFAHLLAFKERGGIKRGGWQSDHHGPHFVDALERVVLAWYGSLDAYPWWNEYRTVRKMAGVCQAAERRA